MENLDINIVIDKTISQIKNILQQNQLPIGIAYLIIENLHYAITQEYMGYINACVFNAEEPEVYHSMTLDAEEVTNIENESVEAE